MSNIRGQRPGIGVGGVHEVCFTISVKCSRSALRRSIERKGRIFLLLTPGGTEGHFISSISATANSTIYAWISLAACTTRRVGVYPQLIFETESLHRRTANKKIFVWYLGLLHDGVFEFFFLDTHLLQLIMAVSSTPDSVTKVPESLPNPSFSWSFNNDAHGLVLVKHT